MGVGLAPPDGRAVAEVPLSRAPVLHLVVRWLVKATAKQRTHAHGHVFGPELRRRVPLPIRLGHCADDVWWQGQEILLGQADAQLMLIRTGHHVDRHPYVAWVLPPT